MLHDNHRRVPIFGSAAFFCSKEERNMGRNVRLRMEKHREHIDRIDARLLQLLNQRAQRSMEIGKIKRQQKVRLVDAQRELTILRRLRAGNPGPLDDHGVEAIFRVILRQSRRLQRSVTT
jgi:chorismate mutase